MNDEIKAILNDFEREKKLLRHPNESWTLEVANGVFDRMMYKASVDLSPEEYELFLRHISVVEKEMEKHPSIDSDSLIEYGNNLISLHQLYPQELFDVYKQAIKDMQDGINELRQR